MDFTFLTAPSLYDYWITTWNNSPHTLSTYFSKCTGAGILTGIGVSYINHKYAPFTRRMRESMKYSELTKEVNGVKKTPKLMKKKKTAYGWELVYMLPYGLSLADFEKKRKVLEENTCSELQFSVRGRRLKISAAVGELPDQIKFDQKLAEVLRNSNNEKLISSYRLNQKRRKSNRHNQTHKLSRSSSRADRGWKKYLPKTVANLLTTDVQPKAGATTSDRPQKSRIVDFQKYRTHRKGGLEPNHGH